MPTEEPANWGAEQSALLSKLLGVMREDRLGCCLHIALEDGNLSDSDLDFCIGAAEVRGHIVCAVMGAMLRAAPERSGMTREELLRAAWEAR